MIHAEYLGCCLAYNTRLIYVKHILVLSFSYMLRSCLSHDRKNRVWGLWKGNGRWFSYSGLGLWERIKKWKPSDGHCKVCQGRRLL